MKTRVRRHTRRLPHFEFVFATMPMNDKKEAYKGLENQISWGVTAGQFFKVTPKGRRIQLSRPV